jgi:hypothetical protein
MADQEEINLPGAGEGNKSSADLLPKYFRTNTNKKFLSATLDPLIKDGSIEKLNGYIGRTTSKAYAAGDSYVPDVTAQRQNYQLEPSVVVKDYNSNVLFYKDYNDYINQIKVFGGNVQNHDRLNAQEYYSWDPRVDWDKLTNYREYYWLSAGPIAIDIYGQEKGITSTYTVELEDQGDSFAYLLSPDGITRNPTIKLYRGQTYKFEVNSPNYPFFIKTRRTKVGFEYDEGTENNGVESGVVTLTLDQNSPDILYFMSNDDLSLGGVIQVMSIEENTEIDVENEIVGKKTYQLKSGDYLSNGMKVNFIGDVTPEKYANGNWYVEGVGKGITLVSEQELEISYKGQTLEELQFDTEAFDVNPFDQLSEKDKDYITINRAALDGNQWSRANRWFHKDVIETSYRIAGVNSTLDQTGRANRPIIEFISGIKLFNNGFRKVDDVDLVDTATTNIMAEIEGTTGYYVDNINLIDGMRVIFTADTDSLIKDKIFTVKLIRFDNERIISLIPDTTAQEGDTVVVKAGKEYAGTQFYFNGTSWIKAQQKLSENQPPLFDLFDADGISLSDSDKYGATDFQGNKLFSYKEGNGTVDSVLGFPITYLNISNIGDIVFECNLLIDSYNYVTNEQKFTVDAEDSYIKVHDKYFNSGYHNAWEKAKEKSFQLVVREYVADLTRNDFQIDVYNNASTLTDIKTYVYVNNVLQTLNDDYSLYSVNEKLFVRFTNDLEENDTIIIKTRSKANKNSNGYYEFPLNLQNNPSNENPDKITLGQLTNHVETITTFHPEVVGTFPGSSNLRDVSNPSVYGSRYVKHSGPLGVALYHITDKNTNIVKALDYASREYTKFQKSFIDLASTIEVSGTAAEDVDLILRTLVEDKKTSDSFYNSGMVPFRAYEEINHIVIDEEFQLFGISEVYDPYKNQDSAILVYLNDELMIFERDYVFTDDNFIQVTRSVTVGDRIVIREYDTLIGNYIPPTPTKLGLLPKYYPVKYADNTYQETVNVIQRHDGSIMTAFDDYRDDLIIELERRIFNNIKIKFDNDLIDLYDFLPNGFRDTSYSRQEIDKILEPLFLKWHKNITTSYTDNTYFSPGIQTTYNYSTGEFKGKALPGNWRGIYNYWYDTDRPHTHPWEMLGFSTQPSWWEEIYGPAPYTSENLILWRDLEKGRIAEPRKERINTKFVRPGLMDIIPSDEFGVLRSPIEANIAQDYDTTELDSNYVFGDQGPVETAWRKSSSYRFALLTAWILAKPAQVLGAYLNRANTLRDVSGIIKYNGEYIRLSMVKDSVSKTAVSTGLITYINNWLYIDGSAGVNEYFYNLENANIQLGIKLAGFTEKNKFRLILDSRTPLNEGNVFVPNENYQVFLNTSTPISSVSYSGVIVEKRTGGYVVRGYDQKFPTFTYKRVIPGSGDQVIRIGAISESFVNWAEEKTYIKGKIVNYNGAYYRVTEDHKSTFSFDSSKFARLAELPTTGGHEFLNRNKFSAADYVTISYGHLFKEIQDVVDFLYGYAAYLEEQGFVFDNFDRENAILQDWSTAIKEFVFWTTQNWAAGTVVALSPGATAISFDAEYAVVDSIVNDFYDYEVYNSNGTRMPLNDLDISRDGTRFSIETVGDAGLYFARLHLVQTEHVIILDNNTVFNDIIYDKPSGYRQDRIKVLGYRTVDWSGGLTSPGFIYDEVKVLDWAPYTTYKISDVVKHKEYFYSAKDKTVSGSTFNEENWTKIDNLQPSQLLPNFDYRAEQFTDFFDLDTDNFDLEQQKLAQHTIGYQKRQYLENIINDDVSQYKFYQGMILDKGTKNVLTKMFDKLGAADKESLEFYEEWAIRLSEYGAVDNFVELDYKIDETRYRLEPQPFELVEVEDTANTDLVYRYTKEDVYSTYEGYNNRPFKETSTAPNFLRSTGNVDLTDVDYNVKFYDDILDIDFTDITDGKTVWISFYGKTWTVKRVVDANIDFVDSVLSEDTGDFMVALASPPEFEVGEILGVRGITTEIDKFWKIKSIDGNNITFETPEPPTEEPDPTDSTKVVFYKLVDARFSKIADINESQLSRAFTPGEFIWIDDINGQWEVRQKQDAYAKLVTVNPTDSFQGFSSDIAVEEYAREILIGDSVYNKVYVYNRSTDKLAFRKAQELDLTDVLASVADGLGNVVALAKDAKFAAISAPDAGSVPTFFIGVWDINYNYQEQDVVYYNGLWYQCLADDTLGGSTPNVSDLWSATGYLPVGEGSPTVTNAGHGWVAIYQRNGAGFYDRILAMQSPSPQDNARFGSQLEFAKVGDRDYRLFVTADGYDGKGKVFVFDWNASTTGWQYQPTKDLPLPGVTEVGMTFGHKVVSNYNATKVAVSAPNIDSTKGSVYVYTYENNAYTLTQTLNEAQLGHDVAQNGDKFGESLAIDYTGNYLVIGVPNYDDTGTQDAGKVEVLKLNMLNNLYAPLQTIKTLAVETQQFGISVSIFDRTLAIGSYGGGRQDEGEVEIYNRYEDLFVYDDSVILDTFADGSTITSFGGNVIAQRSHVFAGVPSWDGNSGGVIDFRRTVDNVWKTHRQAVLPADIKTIKSIVLYNTRTNTLVKELDITDPLQGKLLGVVEQELKYKTYYDPATYTIGTDNVSVDEVDAWDDKHEGEVWWDLGTSRFVNYHQNTPLYRANNWNKLDQHSSVDVYEWVVSEYKPSEWDAISETAEGLSLGVSGTTKYGDSAYSTVRVYDPIAKIFKTKYLYWVKGKKTTPEFSERTIDVKSMADLIADPKGQGYTFAAITGTNSFVLFNCKKFLSDDEVAVNFKFWTTDDTDTNVHRQYQIVSEGLDISIPNDIIVDKWFDSLVGFTKSGLSVPNVALTKKQRYGILNKPRQSMFVNRVEALKQFVEYANYVFSKNILVDDFDLSMLFDKELPPAEYTKDWDVEIDDDFELTLITTGKIEPASIGLRVDNGSIVDAYVINEGRGYTKSPRIKVNGYGTGAELEAVIDTFGRVQSVNVIKQGYGYVDNDSTFATVRKYTVLSNNIENSGKWGTYEYDEKNNQWKISRIQSYDTSKYWNYVDWYATGFSKDTPIDFQVKGSYELADLISKPNQVVKVTNIGTTNSWLLLKRLNNNNTADVNLNYEVVGRQNGTIQLTSSLYNFEANVLGYDGISYEEVPYDSVPVIELRNILDTIRNNIFVDNLQVEFNNLFFNSVRYVLSEQPTVDWIFKTSFVKAKHNVGALEKRITYKNDSLASYQDYVDEVKPFRTKVREFVSSYTNIEETQSVVTDFDLEKGNKIIVKDNQLSTISDDYLTYPNKHWADNHSYSIVEVGIADAGSGYQSAPQITFAGGGGSGATARAFVGQGGRLTKVLVQTPGSGYYSMPEVIINGSVSDEGRPAVLVPILGNNTVRKNNVIIKFDRVQGTIIVDSLDAQDRFSNTGILTEFDLRWPIDYQNGSVAVTVNNEELLASDFTYQNLTKTVNNHTVKYGQVTILNLPDQDAIESVVIDYTKDIDYLKAADRIHYYYKPTEGQVADDLGALMKGVDYGGVSVSGFGFEPQGGWGAEGTTWEAVTWNGSDETIEDIVLYHNDTELTYTFTSVPPSGVAWNIYVNGTRIDDPKFGTEEQTNTNAVMETFVGDDSTRTFTIPVNQVSASVLTGDNQIILRPATSDGSFIPVGVDLDSVVTGGALNYTNANGYNPEDLMVDGDGFVTPTSGGSLEEHIPGQISESVSIFVYNIAKSGGPKVNTISYKADGETKSFAYLADPQSKDAILVKVNNKILRPTEYKYTPNFAAYTDYLVGYQSNKDIKQARVDELVPLISPLETSITNNTLALATVQGDITTKENEETFWLSEVSGYQAALASLNSQLAQEVPGSGPWNAIMAQISNVQSLLQNAQVQLDAVQDELTTLRSTETSLITAIATDQSTLDGYLLEKSQLDAEIDIIDVEIQSISDYLINPGKTIILNTTPSVNDIVSITTFGTNGNDIIIIDKFTGDGSTNEFITPLKYNKNLRCFATVNGTVENPRLFVTDSNYEDTGRLGLRFDPVPVANADIRYTVYNNEAPEYSYIQRQTFVTDISTDAYELEQTPFGNSPAANFTVVFADDKLLNGGHTTTYIAGLSNKFEIDQSDFNYGDFSADLTEVYVNGELKTLGPDYQLDFGQNSIRFNDGQVNEGDTVTIFIMNNADYRVVNGSIVLNDTYPDGTSLMAMTFFNTDAFDMAQKSKSVISRRVITSDSKWYRSSVSATGGILLLPESVADANQVLVAWNGKLLTPSRDYKLIENGSAVQVSVQRPIAKTDVFNIIVFAYAPADQGFAYRQFTDSLNRTHYKAINTAKGSLLARDLNWYDSVIEVVDASGLDEPVTSRNVPGIVFINGERIEYMLKVGNKLSQLRRGTLGTAAPALHEVGSEVQNQGKSLTITYEDTEITKIAYGDGTTTTFDLPFDPLIDLNTMTENWNRSDEVNNVEYAIPAEYGLAKDIEVFVGGKRLDKNPCTMYTPSIDQDSPNGDLAIPAGFSVTPHTDATKAAEGKALPHVRLTTPPAPGEKVVIKKKQGIVWQKSGESLSETKNPIADFLRGQTVSFPK